MAVVAIASPSLAQRGTTGYTSLRSTLVPTTSYVATDSFPCGAFNWVNFHVVFAIGSLTTGEVKPQYSTDGGTTWADIYDDSAAATAGVVPVDILQWQLDASATIGFHLHTAPYELVRVMVKGTGTLTSSTFAVSAAGGITTLDSI